MANSRQASMFAFQCSVRRLFEMSDRVRLWSFTFPVPSPDWGPVSGTWKRLMDRLRRRGADLTGLRVVEWHPGGHGWHIHWLCNHYLDIEVVRPQAEACGFGRINVFVCQTAERYLSKHFLKDRRRAPGMRKWAKTGKWKHTLVRDIEVEGGFKAWLHVRTNGKRIRLDEMRRLLFEYVTGERETRAQRLARRQLIR